MGIFPLGVAFIELMKNGCLFFFFYNVCSKQTILLKSL